MKPTILGSIAMLVSLAAGTLVNAQYGTTQAPALPNYPTTNSAYPLNTNSPSAYPGYRQPTHYQPTYPRPTNTLPTNALPTTARPALPNYGAPAAYGTPNQVAPNQVAPPTTPANFAPPTNYPAANSYPGTQPTNYGGPAPSYPGGPVDIYGQSSSYLGSCGTGCGGSYYGSPVYGGGCDSASYIGSYGSSYGPAAAPAGNGCGPVYTPSVAPAYCAPEVAQPKTSNFVFGLRALIFHRDYEDDRGLAYNPSGQSLFTTDSRVGTIPGVEGFFGKRNCNGFGWEGRYWGLFPSRGYVQFFGSPNLTQLVNTRDLSYPPFNVRQVYDVGTEHRLQRNNEFHNIEFNLLRNAGCAQGWLCKCLNVELLAGIRYFRFDESMRYSTFTALPAYPSELNYDLHVENDLLGFQLGCRTEHCIGKCLRLNVATKFGVYGNNIYHRQSIQNQANVYATFANGPYVGQDYNVSSDKDDVAFMGEFDLGLAYQLGCRTRVNIGYKAVAVAGVALAPDQIPHNFADLRDAQRIDSNGSLILHGGYVGVDFCF